MDKRIAIANMDVSRLKKRGVDWLFIVANTFLNDKPLDRLELEERIFTMKSVKKIDDFLKNTCKVTDYDLAFTSIKRKLDDDVTDKKSNNLITYATHLKDLLEMGGNMDNKSLVKLSSDNHMIKCPDDEVIVIYNHCLDMLVDFLINLLK